ncbi:hypothetical protein [Mucilaginibacter sp.]|uniref:hypothetical protein n=1 Tax=Mucilaginibacter sp. TaxID=1882438 RepID=UPI00262F674E|nr:hypothetical protein [Mucilaginibacter sp.]MDB4926782.1 hypothetical protein [Mucilaginibacter sp.]
MKKLSYFFFPIIMITLYSCDRQPSSEQKDNRPAQELTFIKVLVDADSVYKAQHNEINKKDVFDTSMVKITHFINKNAKAENWQAVIHALDVDALDGAIDVTLRISKGMQFDEKYPQYNAIILKAHIFDNDKIKNMLKPLQAGDKVLVNGKFSTEKDAEDNIKFESFNIGSIDKEETLNNPVFDFNITDIKKTKTI